MPHPAISSTIWPPTPISPAVKDLLGRFFHLADQKDDNVGTVLAEEVFTPDARFVTATGAFEGKEQIATSRAGAWTVVTFRKHTVDKVYATGVNVGGEGVTTDIVLTGKLETRTEDGGSVSTVTDFAARVVFVGGDDKSGGSGAGWRIREYRAWIGRSERSSD
ncbi:hypothetical protein AYO20_10788 [Fonsecaea nubica]|uniref:Uncharacterized protein n=1 Tax=Fonsecaea nubica TaxID=856822 RepID=A0A178C206_9EURO|nr:hypothetical protein AYO20_10788 [Fonsecaea nubica]OAL23938.1 hypothetical protein AYO20_10788 [Fonsecaea nubica]